MDTKDTTIQIKRLAQDVSYYNNVFKKVEKISSVIFYILSFKRDVLDKNVLYKSLEEKSFSVHELSLVSLQATVGERDDLHRLQQSLLSLMSTLQVATAARVIPEDMVTVIVEQIDAVQRYLTNHYLQTEGVSMTELYNLAIEDTTSSTTSATPKVCLLYTSPSPRDRQKSRMPSSA